MYNLSFIYPDPVSFVVIYYVSLFHSFYVYVYVIILAIKKFLDGCPWGEVFAWLPSSYGSSWNFQISICIRCPHSRIIDSLLIWLHFSIALHQWVTGWQGVLATTQRRRLFTQDFQQLYRSFPGLGTVKKESRIDDSQQIEAIRDSRQ